MNMGKRKVVKLNELKLNPNNPRTISKIQFQRLKKSIRDFPQMIELRPIIVDENNVILCGNMRYRALVDLGDEKTVVEIAEGLTEDQKRELLVKDNVGYGAWDFDILANEFDVGLLVEWGVDLPVEKEATEDGEMNFSDELDLESNYVLLKFNKDIDFIHIQTILGLESVYSKRQNGLPRSKGIGRVVDGITAIEKIRNGG